MERSIVRVWLNETPPQYLGTGFLIAAGYVLTAKHVITKANNGQCYPSDNIYLTTDTGVWKGGGDRYINEPIQAETLDIVLLPLKKPVEGACCLPLADSSFELQTEMKVQLVGYSTSNASIEIIPLSISGYEGEYDLEVTHSHIAKGFSGGPVLYDGKLVAVIRAQHREQNKTYLIRLNSFRSFIYEKIGIQFQPITLDELTELNSLILSSQITFEQANRLFKKVQPNSRAHEADNVEGVITFLSQKQHEPPHQAPLLEFVEYILESANQETKVKLINWQNRVANRLDIDLKIIRRIVHQYDQEAQSEKPICPAVILIKIEPEQWISTDQFQISAWCFYQGAFLGQESSLSMVSRKDLTTEASTMIRNLIQRYCIKILPRLDFILPICLFDWDLNAIEIPTGPRLSLLGKHCPTVFRSWERIYHNKYTFTVHSWHEKWANMSLISNKNIHCINDSSVNCDELWMNLTEQSWVFLMLCLPPNDNDQRELIMGTALAAGIPFMFWPLSNNCNIANLRQSLDETLFKHEQCHWPDKVHQQRKVQNDWNHLAMLWDDPNLQPPDTNPHLQAPVE